MSESIAQKVEKYFEVFPNLTFDQVVGFVPGLTIENFRMIKSRYNKKIDQDDQKENNNNIKNYTNKNVKSEFHDQKKIKKLNANTTEKLILDMLNKKSTIPESQIRIAVDFMVKVKRNEKEGDELLIDAKYLKLAESEEGVEHQPDDKVEVELVMEEFLKEGLDARNGALNQEVSEEEKIPL